ncbi:MAG: hypothetical protein CMC18_01540 [Flavobacteriaceae bacterium]|nr:hypothetical protein [Flavobacteriaceae bacterium]
MRKPNKASLFCRIKWVFYVFFLLGISCSVIAQSDRVPLKEILKEISLQFDVSLSYRAQLVEDVFVLNPIKFSDIKAAQDWLDSNTELGFYHLDSRYYYITAKRNVWSLCGRIIDDFTYVPLSNVRLSYNLKSTFTDEDGFFQLDVFTNTPLIKFSHPEYPAISLGFNRSSNCETFYFSREVIALNEVKLTYQLKGIKKSSQRYFTFNRNDEIITPGSIQNDVFKMAETIPGVTNADDATGNLYIQGNAPDHNAIYWNGIRMFKRSHVFGGISVVNPFSIDQVKLIKNGLSPRWGDQIGGQLQMVTQVPKKEALARVGINLLDFEFGTRLSFSDKWFARLSFRHSNPFSSAQFASPYIDKIKQGSSVTEQTNTFDFLNYSDYQVSVEHRINEKNKLSFHHFNAIDELQYSFNQVNTEVQEQFESSNYGWSLQWKSENKKYSTFTSLSQSIFSSRFNQIENNIVTSAQEEFVNQRGNSLNYTSLETFLEYPANENLILYTGLDYNRKQIFEKESQSFREEKTDRQEQYDTRMFALFVDASYLLTPEIQLETGIRLQKYNTRDALLLEPRIRFQYRLGNRLTFHSIYELKSQNAFQIQEAISQSLENQNQIWVGANGTNYPILRSEKWALNAAYNFENTLIDLEYFNAINSGLNASLFGFLNADLGAFTDGEFRANGINTLIRQRFKSGTTWVSYTYLDAEQSLASNQWFPANFSIRNQLSLGGQYEFNTYTLGLNAVFRNGVPYSVPSGVDVNPTNPSDYTFTYDEGFNQRTLRNYSRLDFFMNKKLSLKSIDANLRFSVQNVFSTENIIARKYTFDPINQALDIADRFSAAPVINVGFFLAF